MSCCKGDKMNPIDQVLDRLEKVRKRQPGQWSACCPAHVDKGPSLSVRETPDGAVLLHCFAGCEVQDVVSALGLRLNELFPLRDKPQSAPRKIARLLSPIQALELLSMEANLVAVAGSSIAKGVELTEADKARLLQAVGRITAIAGEVSHA